jgi:hypothetical protein
MNLIKIAVQIKMKFLEFYEIKEYKKQSSEQFVVKKYVVDNKKILIDEKDE